MIFGVLSEPHSLPSRLGGYFFGESVIEGRLTRAELGVKVYPDIFIRIPRCAVNPESSCGDSDAGAEFYDFKAYGLDG